MRAVYNTPEDIAPEDIALEDTAPEDITEDTTPEEIILATTQDSDNQASYEFHAMQVKHVHEKVAQNNKTYQNRLIIRGSVHRRKVVFESEDKSCDCT
ncbi:hypothetical protein F8M41_014751 [Gigaspora margarita]|uniref:Uncharacterized protein n=1 Tax=Gigaspora margarita TaxID=4874 RepID=A0A8H4ARC4_GIGMA|nr:hypothetical protein F8M41_014751 [Gigaspora margarita]